VSFNIGENEIEREIEGKRLLERGGGEKESDSACNSVSVLLCHTVYGNREVTAPSGLLKQNP
jgi:hypothetical protein